MEEEFGLGSGEGTQGAESVECRAMIADGEERRDPEFVGQRVRRCIPDLVTRPEKALVQRLIRGFDRGKRGSERDG